MQGGFQNSEFQNLRKSMDEVMGMVDVDKAIRPEAKRLNPKNNQFNSKK